MVCKTCSEMQCNRKELRLFREFSCIKTTEVRRHVYHSLAWRRSRKTCIYSCRVVMFPPKRKTKEKSVPSVAVAPKRFSWLRKRWRKNWTWNARKDVVAGVGPASGRAIAIPSARYARRVISRHSPPDARNVAIAVKTSRISTLCCILPRPSFQNDTGVGGFSDIVKSEFSRCCLWILIKLLHFAKSRCVRLCIERMEWGKILSFSGQESMGVT